MGILLFVVIFGLVIVGVASLWNLRRRRFGGDPAALLADRQGPSDALGGISLRAVEIASKTRAAHRGANYGDIGPR